MKDKIQKGKNLGVDESILNEKDKHSKVSSSEKKVTTKLNNKVIKDSNNHFDDFSELLFEELKTKKSLLDKEIEKLNKKKSTIEKEISSSFNGQSESIAIKVKGFQDYLQGALQDLVQSVEQLELVNQPLIVKPSPLDKEKDDLPAQSQTEIQAISETFKPDEDIIRECLKEFQDQPDFYAAAWKLRRSLNNNEINLLEDWFFNLGGRGALPSTGNRSKNILISSALISILGELFGDQFQTLILAAQPERLGEWRRGLQDCLGLTREDFGPASGIVLFERPEALIERADRLEDNGEVPLILIDAAERSVEVPILQFPLWLAFAGTEKELFEDSELI